MAQRPLAIFTIACNEPFFFPMWLKHYRHHAPEAELFVLADRNYRSEMFDFQLGLAQNRNEIAEVKVEAPKAFDHAWLRETVQSFQAFLLKTYRWTLFAEIDELWIHPADSLDAAVARLNPGATPFVAARGYDVAQAEDEDACEVAPQRPFLADRRRWAPSILYSKPTLCAEPATWSNGFHRLLVGQASPSPDLMLVHLHKYDFATALARSREIRKRDWSKRDTDARLGWQNRIDDEGQMRTYFERSIDDNRLVAPFEPIPDWVRKLV